MLVLGTRILEIGVYFGAFPHMLGVLGVILDDWQDASCDYTMGSAEVMINFWRNNVNIILL